MISSIFVAMDNSCRSALFMSSSLATLNFQFFIKGIANKMYIFLALFHFTTRCLWHQKILSSVSSFCWYASFDVYAPLGMTVPFLSCHASKHDQESQCKQTVLINGQPAHTSTKNSHVHRFQYTLQTHKNIPSLSFTYLI